MLLEDNMQPWKAAMRLEEVLTSSHVDGIEVMK